MDRTFPDLPQEAESLLARDFLYEHPESYRAGVLAALSVLAASEPAGVRSSA